MYKCEYMSFSVCMCLYMCLFFYDDDYWFLLPEHTLHSQKLISSENIHRSNHNNATHREMREKQLRQQQQQQLWVRDNNDNVNECNDLFNVWQSTLNSSYQVVKFFLSAPSTSASRCCHLHSFAISHWKMHEKSVIPGIKTTKDTFRRTCILLLVRIKKYRLCSFIPSFLFREYIFYHSQESIYFVDKVDRTLKHKLSTFSSKRNEKKLIIRMKLNANMLCNLWYTKLPNASRIVHICMLMRSMHVPQHHYCHLIINIDVEIIHQAVCKLWHMYTLYSIRCMRIARTHTLMFESNQFFESCHGHTKKIESTMTSPVKLSRK